MKLHLSFFAGCAFVIVACGSTAKSQFGDGTNDPDGGDLTSGGFGSSGGLGDGGAGDKPCTNLCLKQVTCAGGGTTSLSGSVRDPAGNVPLYNAVVYVPNAPLAPLTTGASCDRCGAVSGDPLVTATSDAAGNFKLDNVPAGVDIPLVVQIGKWRRQITIPAIPQCTETKLDAGVVRLPRNKAEGDLPQMAIATGDADPFECLLTKMGIDTAEFTPDSSNGRVHYYVDNGIDLAKSASKANTLYNNIEKMKEYDLIFLPCEGGEDNKPANQDKNLLDYTSIGGRVFTTHFGYAWLSKGAEPFPKTGDWSPDPGDGIVYVNGFPVRKYDEGPQLATVNTSFPKGKDFAQWLVNVNATDKVGQMNLNEVRHDLGKAFNPPATTWMTVNNQYSQNKDATVHITFNTPIGVPEEQQCGRVVYSDFHVSAQAKTGASYFPASCKTGQLSPQEKALEFMLFDLSSCIQSDSTPPVPPPVVR